MSSTTITTAMHILEPLKEALEAAYWDSNNINTKDHIFELIMSVQHEMSELAKLSVSDMDLPYEAITIRFSSSCEHLRNLFYRIEQEFPRKQTADKLLKALPDAADLLSTCPLEHSA